MNPTPFPVPDDLAFMVDKETEDPAYVPYHLGTTPYGAPCATSPRVRRLNSTVFECPACHKRFLTARAALADRQRYHDFVGRAAVVTPLNQRLFDVLLRADWDATRLEAYLAQRAFLAERVRDHAESSELFQQPAVLWMYGYADLSPNTLRAVWPLTLAELEPIFTDLGISTAALQ